jgi:hypothetical protein
MSSEQTERETSERVLPAEFAELERFADWAIPTERARYEKRLASSMEEMQALYDAVLPRLNDSTDYLKKLSMDGLGESEKRLVWLFCSLAMVSYPVEVWGQAKVPDSGAAYLNAVEEPEV